ncbi:hypothetical protein [Nocardioides marmotae]|uniref:Uncharacterized protein n=1 Tax=Nocardioides marmotae TaxID=2663857 RepID=A0A6I3JG90_9ACTN|nr:hypothetical protein [Nocardioides marmotae]MCR6033397.1 hypothetical protein [Gordonia jinghuaiqii]MBC9734737.1 hypothetical protein [Nocardioides marmotae]MTB85839.1 hypothetical protein [Nocardioides marmotae]MTB97055.1 hypothetical protein [Nocardioides marmotae]QKE00716.1 hypothetical protein HPC71_06215 [Nocardioides marmotae]
MVYLADIGGALGAVMTAAQQVVVDATSAAEVISLLDETIGEIKERDVVGVGETSFGTLPSASTLAHHTELARQTIVEALVDLKAGLRVYAENVDAYRKDQFGTDGLVASENITPIEAGIDCVTGDVAAQNDLAAPQCVAPGGSDN